MKSLKLLICGGRNFDNFSMLSSAIKQIQAVYTIDIIIEGGAPGADTLAKVWAKHNGIHFAEVPALWDNYKRRAGGLRNSAMLILKPNYCLAMPGGPGTRDMIRKCIDANIVVWSPYR